MTIKLVALDLDDTLLDNTQTVSPRTKKAIIQAVAQGVTVTLATGRMYSSAVPYARQLGLDVPIITYNGGLIRSSLSEETLFHQPIDSGVTSRVMALFRERGWYIQSYLEDVLYVRELDENAKLYERVSGIKAVPVGDRLYSLPGVPTKLLAMAKPEKLQQIYEIVQDAFGDDLYITFSKPTYLEMTHPTVNKGRALEFLAARLNISREEVMAVGDSNNDLDMLKYAGWGVAMGNASEKVRAAAQAVTSGNDADGVAEAIEKFVLRNC